MTTEQTPQSTTNKQAGGAETDEGERLTRSIAARTEWVQRALSPWPRRWLSIASGPAGKVQTRLDSPGAAPLTVKQTASLLQRVQRAVEVAPGGRSNPISVHPLQLDRFSGTIVSRFPEIRRRFEPRPAEGGPTNPTELVLAGTGEIAAEAGVPQPEPEGFKPFTSFNDFMDALEAKRRESEGAALGSAQPPAPVQRAPAIQPGPYNKPFTSFAAFMDALEATRRESEGAPSDQPAAPVQRAPAIQPGPYNKPFTSLAEFLEAVEAAKRRDATSADTPSESSTSPREPSSAPSVQRESANPVSDSPPPFPSPRRPRPRARIEEVTSPAGNVSRSASPESKVLAEVLPTSPMSDLELNRPAASSPVQRQPASEKLAPQASSDPLAEPAGQSSPELGTEGESPTSGAPPIQRMSGLESSPDEPQQGESKSRPAAAGQVTPSMPLPQAPVETGQPAPESSGDTGVLSEAMPLPVEAEQPKPDSTPTRAAPPVAPTVPPVAAGQSAPATPVQRMPLPDMPPVELERPEPSAQQVRTAEMPSDEASRPGKPETQSVAQGQPAAEMPEAPQVEAARPAPSVQRVPSPEAGSSEATRPEKPDASPGEGERPTLEMPLQEFPLVEVERPTPPVQRTALPELGPDEPAQPGKLVTVPEEGTRPVPEPESIRTAPSVEPEASPAKAAQPAPSVQRVPLPEAGSSEIGELEKAAARQIEAAQPLPEPQPIQAAQSADVEVPPAPVEQSAPVQRTPLPESASDKAGQSKQVTAAPAMAEPTTPESQPIRTAPSVEPGATLVEAERPGPSMQRAPLPELELDEAARPEKPVAPVGEVDRPTPEMPAQESLPIEAKAPGSKPLPSEAAKPEAPTISPRPAEPSPVSAPPVQRASVSETSGQEFPGAEAKPAAPVTSSEPVQRQSNLPLDMPLHPHPPARGHSPEGELSLDQHILAKAQTSSRLPLLEAGPQLSRMIQRSLTKTQSLPQMRAQLGPAGVDGSKSRAEEVDFSRNFATPPSSRVSETTALPLVPPSRVEVVERSVTPAVAVPAPLSSPSPVTLAVQRQIASPEAPVRPAETDSAEAISQLIQREIVVPEVSSEQPGQKSSKIDLDKLARQIYPLIKRMLAVERERRPIH